LDLKTALYHKTKLAEREMREECQTELLRAGKNRKTLALFSLGFPRFCLAYGIVPKRPSDSVLEKGQRVSVEKRKKVYIEERSWRLSINFLRSKRGSGCNREIRKTNSILQKGPEGRGRELLNKLASRKHARPKRQGKSLGGMGLVKKKQK